MKAIQVDKVGGELKLVELEIPNPPAGWVRIKIRACGVCHSDSMMLTGLWPATAYPRIPGHEVAGVIDALGEGVHLWKVGQPVGVGWYGGHCGECIACRRGNFVYCRFAKISGFTQDGGYAEYMVTPKESLALIPDGLPFEEAGPLMCAGVTTFNALRHSGAMPGDLVAIQAIGGLGHLAVQFASRAGYRTVAISRGKEAEALSLKLGAHAYLDSDAVDAAAELQKMGGATVILSTAPSGKAMSGMIDGLGDGGLLLVIGAAGDPIQVAPAQLIGRQKEIKGWYSGIATDSEDTMNFSALTGVRPMIETYPLEQAPEAYARMMSGKATFRVVLNIS
ncbi:MAG TPA: alcohol dehydrogenase [Bryobacteraceae bacterium]|nr:alcohol dehydrogenase [Bryobacteraceae bacterium]